MSFSLPQRPSLSFGSLLSGPGGRVVEGGDAILEDRTPPSTPSHSLASYVSPSVTISIPPEDEEGEGGSRRWVLASFERAARRSHSNLDPQLKEYFHGVQLEAPGGAYPCRCHNPISTASDSSPTGSNTAESQDEDGEVLRRRGHGLPGSYGAASYGASYASPRCSPEQEYEAIVDAYYPQEFKNRAKFSLLEESPPAEGPAGEPACPQEARRPSCLKKVLRKDTPPSDQSSPSLSTSVLHQLRSYYDESYLAFSDHGEDLTSPEDLDDELPPPRERTAAFSSKAPPPAPSPPRLVPISFTCKDADQLKYVDADSDTGTPVTDVIALVHSPPPSHIPPSPGTALGTGKGPTLSVKSSSPCLLSPDSAAHDCPSTSTSPRPKFLTQSSSSSQSAHSASPRSKRQSSADNGYFEGSVGRSLSSPPISSTSNDGLSTDSVINLTSSSASPSPSLAKGPGLGPPRGISPAASASTSKLDDVLGLGHGLSAVSSSRPRLKGAFQSLSEESALLPKSESNHLHLAVHGHRAMATQCAAQPTSSEHVALLVRPTTLVIKKTYSRN